MYRYIHTYVCMFVVEIVSLHDGGALSLLKRVGKVRYGRVRRCSVASRYPRVLTELLSILAFLFALLYEFWERVRF